MTGENLNGDLIDARFLLPLAEAGADGETRLRDHAGIDFRQDAGKVFVDGLAFGGPAEQLGIDWDWELSELNRPRIAPLKSCFTFLHSCWWPLSICFKCVERRS